MKININDVSKLEDIKKALKENRVSDKTINVIEKALQSGFKFRSTDDFSIFSLTAADVGILRDLVVFEPTGYPATGSDTVFTYRYFFKPVGNANYFHSYQFIISYTQTDGLRVSEAFPIEDNRMVIVDLDHSEIASSIPILYQVKSATGEITEIRFQNSPDF